MARPKLVIDDELCNKAEAFAAQGLTVKQIAHSLGMGESTFYSKKTGFKEFKEALEVGKSKGIATVTNALFNKAKGGDVPAIKVYLYNVDPENWADRREHTVKGHMTHEDSLAHLRWSGRI